MKPVPPFSDYPVGARRKYFASIAGLHTNVHSNEIGETELSDWSRTFNGLETERSDWPNRENRPILLD